MLKAASIGFIPIKFRFDAKRGGFDFDESSLLEWSVVSVPALPTALIEPGQTGKAMTEHEWRQREQARRRRELEFMKLKG